MSSDWWRDAVIYQVYPRSFADADGDGIGDLTGIRQRLAHIASLGADALWLSPFYQSPMNDAGYDVSDYRVVDPIFGSVADLESLVREAHACGLRVIVDIVPNHTSSEHPWFQEALAAGIPSHDAPLRTQFTEGPWSRYHLVRGTTDTAPNNWPCNFGGGAWTQLPAVDGSPSGWWYLHLFDPTQPDLNWNNPEVRDEFLDILRFWFDRGVDGFRIDVANSLMKAPGYPDAPLDRMGDEIPPPMPMYDRDDVHEIYRTWREVADSYEPQRVFVAEAWVRPLERLALYVRPDELHTAFNFDHLRTPWWAPGLKQTIDDSLAAMEAIGAPTTWVLENHDVWRAPTRYAPVAGHDEGAAWTDLWDRTDTNDSRRDLTAGLRRARAALLVMLALPGSAYIYQGQELGLFEVLDLPPEVRQDPTFRLTEGAALGRDGCRVPIPWEGTEPSYGFGPSQQSWLPQPREWAALSVQAQRSAPGSTLELTRSALALRRSHPALGAGTMRWDSHDLGPTVLSFVRPSPEGSVRCVVAMEGDAVTLPLHWGTEDSILLSSESLTTGPSGALVLPTDSAVWLRA